MLNTILALALAAAPAPSAHQRDVEQAIFDICPRAMSGALSFDDAAQVAAAGYRATTPRSTPSGPMPQIERGAGTGRILVSARRDGGATCGVWFGGPENRQVLRALRRRVRAAGYRGSRVNLGDGTPIQILRQQSGDRRVLTIIEGNAGGDLDFAPATTVVLIDPKD